MGKKAKIGKARKDKFYQLAKEAGYRSRAAFKLLQLNRTHHFLEKSRVCIDLCAAPGGWLQVAATHMPMSSLIIGIDLAPIRPIGNVITHVEDITSDKCRQLLKKDLSDNKADLVLHDGAPNVGKNWIHDAYQQNLLVLQSFKLATEFLSKGGHFVTKVFRSKDYYALMWVFQQFFKKVESTKPQASRNESAEIFVVCQHFKAPERIDPKFFDIKYVFSEVDGGADVTKKISDLFKSAENVRRNRGGYEDGDYTLFHKLKASEFLNSENFIELLARSNYIEIDDERIAKHPASTGEMKECFKDLKLLGKADIKNLLKWRLRVKSDLEKEGKSGEDAATASKTAGGGKAKENGQKEEDSNDEDKLDQEIQEALHEEKKLDKKQKRKLQKEKQKLKERLALKMEYTNDIVDHTQQGDNEIFSLNKIRTKKQLLELQKTLPSLNLIDDDEVDEDNVPLRQRKRKQLVFKDEANLDEQYDIPYKKKEGGGSSGDESDNEEPEIDLRDSDNDEDEEERRGKPNQFYSSDEDENPLLAKLANGEGGDKKTSKSNLWFNKEAFDFLKDSTEQNKEIMQSIDLDEDDDDDNENRKGKKETKAAPPSRVYDSGSSDSSEGEDGDDDDDDDDSSDDEANKSFVSKKGKKRKRQAAAANAEETEEKKKVKLTPEELAVGEMIVNSKKKKSELIDDSYNRYSTMDDPEALPEWFVEDEQVHWRRDSLAPRNLVSQYKKKYQGINDKPIKKVIEAQARKKRRTLKKLDKVKRKTENITNNEDMSEKEKRKEMKLVYRKAGLISVKKPEIKYVVAKKGLSGKAMAKSKGVKGPYRVVDKRLKKDKMKAKKMKKKPSGGGGGGRKGGARGGKGAKGAKSGGGGGKRR